MTLFVCLLADCAEELVRNGRCLHLCEQGMQQENKGENRGGKDAGSWYWCGLMRRPVFTTSERLGASYSEQQQHDL